ncbi:MAG: urease accessory protein UreF [Pigmentiphaga sp.]|nr:urease accessory protein UreF [Pigmentiphaga sp.]
MTATTVELSASQLTALHQLSSPALPVGGYSYSQGLEAAVELGLVTDEASAQAWIGAQLRHVVTDGDAPLWCLLHTAWLTTDASALRHWNQWFLSSREAGELRHETLQMGASLLRLGRELGWFDQARLQLLAAVPQPTLPLLHSMACAALDLPQLAGLSSYLYSWLENQTTAALKSVPLGQVAAQRILHQLRQQLPPVLDEARRRSQATPPQLQTLAPQYAIVASRHAHQFSRLFRS